MRGIIILLIGIYLLGDAVAKKFKVGIVGGGIGGTAAAYHLRSLLNDMVDITLFEGDSIGGRLATRSVGGKQYEAGGAIAIPRNRYMVDLCQKLGLKHRLYEPTTYSALYDGNEVLFAESNWKAILVAKLWWRYRFDIYYLNNYIDQLIDNFENIYLHQQNLEGYDNVTALLAAMKPDLPKELTLSTKERFTREGFSNLIIEELVAATLRVNYGQHLKAHAFVGSVSVAGAGGGLWAVEGGNFLVPQRLLEESRARVVKRIVKRVLRLPNEKIAVVPSARSDIPPEGEDKEYQFDAVVIATPQTEDHPDLISFDGFSKAPTFEGRYHRTVCYLLRGSLRREKFPGLNPYTDEILTTKPGLLFNSLGRVFPVDSESSSESSDVWKVFSNQLLTKDDLASIFTDVNNVTVVDWLAYPQYGTEQRSDSFLLAPGLYHVNAIEWAASAMEMSLVGAHNVAILARNKWCASNECSPPEKKHVPSNEEL